MSRSDGFTLLEAMVSLAIMALMLTVSISAINRGSPRLERQGEAVKLLAKARAARRHAIETGAPVLFAAEDADCDGEISPRIVFYGDGSASGGEFCITRDGYISRITLDGLTGRMEVRK